VQNAVNRPPLARPRRVVVAGVCLALAGHLGWSVRRTRFLAVVLTLCGGAGALLYLWLWAFVPLEEPAAAPGGDPTRSGEVRGDGAVPEGGARAGGAVRGDGDTDDAASVRRSAPAATLLVGLAAIAALVFLGGGRNSSVALIVTTVASGLAVVWSLTFDRHDPDKTAAHGIRVRLVSVAALVIAGSSALASRPTAAGAVLGVAMVVLGVAVVAAPRVVSLWSDLMGERAARVREVQRAEIAAHLHDSVLQTLALIQNRAGASSEVARIARAQERELRDWLFVGDTPVIADLATELRDAAAAIELDYPARIEVVTAGASVERPGAALVAAAREAMLNAARHAGGDVSVYLESSPGGIDVFVRDRGPGVDLSRLPTDRHGIRESIIGRMSRAGGTATVRPGLAGAGTEVHLHLEVARA
jgi:signal transduction histidine kinase/phage shock protein PspC (stress-responsive transcriptional regulator)